MYDFITPIVAEGVRTWVGLVVLDSTFTLAVLYFVWLMVEYNRQKEEDKGWTYDTLQSLLTERADTSCPTQNITDYASQL